MSTMILTDTAEIAFAIAAVAAIAALGTAAVGRVALQRLVAVAGVFAILAAAGWVVFAFRPTRELAAAVAGLTVCAAAIGAAAALARAVARNRELDAHFALAEQNLVELIGREAESRGAELERTLARARADTASLLQAEERRLAETHRRQVADREEQAGADLVAAVATTQQRVEQRLSEWAQDLERTQTRFATQLSRLAEHQQTLIAETEARIAVDADRLKSDSEQQHATVVRLREELERQTRETVAAASAELEGYALERRRTLDELTDRLRRRERTLAEQIEREEAEAAERIQASFADVERRQIEGLERVVSRASARYSEEALLQFADEVKAAREGAAQRLTRELERAVAAFSREAEGVISERLAAVGDVAAKRLEQRLGQVTAGIERQRDDVLVGLQLRLEEVELEFRRHLDSLAADGEAEREVLVARLRELGRRVDETIAHAQERLATLESLGAG